MYPIPLAGDTHTEGRGGLLWPHAARSSGWEPRESRALIPEAWAAQGLHCQTYVVLLVVPDETVDWNTLAKAAG